MTQNKNSVDTASFTADIKWGYCNDDVDINLLPSDFMQAKKLWSTKTTEDLAKAFELMKPYITCLFIDGGCNGDLSEIFSQNMDEIVGNNVTVYGLDFGESNLPKVRAFSRFENIKTNGHLNVDRLDAWQDENGYLDNCVSFEWRIDGLDEDLDLCSWNHSGLSLLINN